MLFVAICAVDMFAGFAASLRRARRNTYVAEQPVAPAPAPYVAPPAPRAEPFTPAPVVRAEPPKADPAIVVLPRAEPVVRVEPVQKIEP